MRAHAVVVALLAGMVAVLAVAGRLPTGDGPHLAGAELRLAQLLLDGEVGLAWRMFVTLIAPQPPLGYLPGVATSILFGGARLGSLLAMGLSLLLVWDALRRLGAGWPAFLLLVASPAVWLYVGQHGRDLVAGAAVLQAISWLHASGGLRDRRASVAFGLWMAVCLLTKYTTPFFLWAPCLLAGVAVVRGRTWKNLGIAIAACLLVAGPWWLAYGERAVNYLVFSAGSPGDIGNARAAGATRTLEGLAYYPLALKDALGWPGLLLALAGFGFRGAPRLALASALGGLAVLSQLNAAQDRYALPALCALVAGAARLPSLATLAVGLPLLAGSAYDHRAGAPTVEGTYAYPLSTATVPSWPRSRSWSPEAFDAEAWGLARAVDEALAIHGSDEGTIGLLLSRAPDAPQFAQVMQVAGARGMRWDYATVNLAYDPRGERGQPEPWFLGPLFDGAWPPRDIDTLLAILPARPENEARNWLAAHASQLREAVRWTLPNGGEGVVFRFTNT